MKVFSEIASKVLSYWFGEIPDVDDASFLSWLEERNQLWFARNSQRDRVTAELFEDTLKGAAVGELISWEENAETCLALLILLDQISREIYRGTPRSFFFDPLALRIAKVGLEKNFDSELHPIERVFMYLPLEHDESIIHQEESVERFQKLSQVVPEQSRKPFDVFCDYAVAHKRTIEKFGRFPGRNAILGRASTREELDFLDTGKSFVF